MTFDEAVARLRGAEQGGFDVSATRAGAVVHEAIRRLASRSLWIKAVIELGPTVNGQSDYALPDNVVDLESLRVGGARYGREGFSTYWEVSNGDRYLLASSNGIFSPGFDATGEAEKISIYPVPTASGTPMSGLAAIFPTTTYSGSMVLPFPADMDEAITDFCKGILYRDLDENAEMADYYLTSFGAQADELRRRSNSRVGSGPSQIRVLGR